MEEKKTRGDPSVGLNRKLQIKRFYHLAKNGVKLLCQPLCQLERLTRFIAHAHAQMFDTHRMDTQFSLLDLRSLLTTFTV